MHVDAGKLVRVAIDHLRHPCEVRRDGLRVRLDDQVVVAGDVLQEVAVVDVVAHQWGESYGILALFPQLQVVVREDTQLLGEALDCVHDLLDEDLEHRVRPCEALAILVAKLLEVVVLSLQDELSSISRSLVREIAVDL